MLTLEQFAAFVEREAVWFRGFNRETRSSLEQAERDLGQPLPATLKWLLSNFGYWRATGVGGLPFVVGTTSSFRPTFPESWMILSRPTLKRIVPEAECGPADRGVVVLVTSPAHLEDGRAVLICDVHGHIWRRYSGFAPYVVALQQQLARAANLLYRDCLPSFHQQNSGVMDADEQGFDLEEFRQRLLEAMLCQQLDAQLQASSQSNNAAGKVQPTEAAAPATPGDTAVPGNTATAAISEAVSFPTPEACDRKAIAEEVRRELGVELTSAEALARSAAEDNVSTRESSRSDDSGTSAVPVTVPSSALTDAAGRLTAAGQNPKAATGSEGLEQEVQQIMLDRRETLQRADVDIPRECFHNSSSPNRALRLPDHLPGGRLLATSLEMVGNPLDLLGGVLDPSQHIAILQRRTGRVESHWLISWVADSQLTLLTHFWFQLTGAQPDWILDSGDDLAELPHRLQRTQEAA